MKAYVVDDGRYMTLGSFNQDIWSFYCNNEANILLVNEGDSVGQTQGYRTFMKVFNNLKRECREVDMDEKLSPMGYIENAWWKFFLGCSYFTSRNR